MSLEQRQIDQVLAVIHALASSGTVTFRPGDVADALRASGEPMGTWQIRSILTELEANSLIEIDPKSSNWSLRSDSNQMSAG